MRAYERLTKPRRCRTCGAAIEQPATGRTRQFCKNSCRQRAYDARQRRKAKAPNDSWGTPPELFAKLDAAYGPFTLDAAASPENALCPAYLTVEDDALSALWTGVVWCNPPYSELSRRSWVEHAYRSSLAGATVVMLLPGRIGMRWWIDWATLGEPVWLPGRQKFVGASGSARFDSVLVIFRPPS